MQMEVGMNTESGPVHLSILVDEVYDAHRLRFESKGIRFRRGPLPVVEGDEEEIRRLLTELMTHAISHMGNAPEREVEICSRDGGEESIVIVRDTGSGLAMACPGLEAGPGRMWVESTRGEGSTVYLALPKSFPEPALS
jgi:signal transduction histidine kinase